MKTNKSNLEKYIQENKNHKKQDFVNISNFELQQLIKEETLRILLEQVDPFDLPVGDGRKTQPGMPKLGELPKSPSVDPFSMPGDKGPSATPKPKPKSPPPLPKEVFAKLLDDKDVKRIVGLGDIDKVRLELKKLIAGMSDKKAKKLLKQYITPEGGTRFRLSQTGDANILKQFGVAVKDDNFRQIVTKLSSEEVGSRFPTSGRESMNTVNEKLRASLQEVNQQAKARRKKLSEVVKGLIKEVEARPPGFLEPDDDLRARAQAGEEKLSAAATKKADKDLAGRIPDRKIDKVVSDEDGETKREKKRKERALKKGQRKYVKKLERGEEFHKKMAEGKKLDKMVKTDDDLKKLTKAQRKALTHYKFHSRSAISKVWYFLKAPLDALVSVLKGLWWTLKKLFSLLGIVLKGFFILAILSLAGDVAEAATTSPSDPDFDKKWAKVRDNSIMMLPIIGDVYGIVNLGLELKKQHDQQGMSQRKSGTGSQDPISDTTLTVFIDVDTIAQKNIESGQIARLASGERVRIEVVPVPDGVSAQEVAREYYGGQLPKALKDYQFKIKND